MTEEPTASSGVDVGTRSVSDYTLPKDRGQSTSDDNRSSEYMRMNVYLTPYAGHEPATNTTSPLSQPFSWTAHIEAHRALAMASPHPCTKSTFSSKLILFSFFPLLS